MHVPPLQLTTPQLAEFVLHNQKFSLKGILHLSCQIKKRPFDTMIFHHEACDQSENYQKFYQWTQKTKEWSHHFCEDEL